MGDERRDPRGRKIATQLEGFLDEGEAFVVECEGEKIRVFEAGDDDFGKIPSRLGESHPQLHGTLLQAEQALDDAGSGVNKLVWILSAVLIASLVTGWLWDALHLDVAAVRSFWVYVGLLILTVVVTSAIGNLFERIRFAGLRKRLYEAMDDAGLEVETVLSVTSKDGTLSTVAKHLKRDGGRSKKAW